MKRIAILILVLALLPGCSGVLLNAEYSRLLDETAALSDATADAAEAGRLDPNQMTQALRKQAAVWEQFRAGRDGREQ